MREKQKVEKMKREKRTVSQGVRRKKRTRTISKSPEKEKQASQKKEKEKQLKKSEQAKQALWMKIAQGVWNVLFYLVTIGLILSAVLFGFNDNQEKNIFGYQVFNVRTNSMVPRDPAKQKGGFQAGDVIIIRKVREDEVKPGDIVTFHPNPKSSTYLTHRVVKVVEELNGRQGPFMITQGDANKSADSPTPVKQVVGKKVFTIPKLGYLLSFVRTHLVVSLVFLCSLFGSVILVRLYLFQGNERTKESGQKNKKRFKRKETSY